MSVGPINNNRTIQQIIDDGAKKTEERNTGEMDKDQFLNLLVTQLKYQDPLNPVDDKEFIGQMAQFSSLEQMQNLNKNFSATKAFGMIGKNITAEVVDDVTKDKTAIDGIVSNVKMSGGKTFLVVDGNDVPVDSVLKVSEGNPYKDSNISAYTGLIGYEIKGSLVDPETSEQVNIKGMVKELATGEHQDYAVIDDAKVQITRILSNTSLYGNDEKRDYLNGMKGSEIEVVIIDPETGRQGATKGELVDFEIDIAGGIKATLNKIQVPVESISNITTDE